MSTVVSPDESNIVDLPKLFPDFVSSVDELGRICLLPKPGRVFQQWVSTQESLPMPVSENRVFYALHFPTGAIRVAEVSQAGWLTNRGLITFTEPSHWMEIVRWDRLEENV